MKTLFSTLALLFGLSLLTIAPANADAQGRDNLSRVTARADNPQHAQPRRGNRYRPVTNTRNTARRNPNNSRRRAWVDGHWNRGPRGRVWVPGRYEVRVVRAGAACPPARRVVHHAMAPTVFDNAYQRVARRNFESGRMETALRIVHNQWMTAGQVRDLMGLMSFESSRLRLAKAAYANTVDKQNYFVVNEMFSFDSSVGELERFVYGY